MSVDRSLPCKHYKNIQTHGRLNLVSMYVATFDQEKKKSLRNARGKVIILDKKNFNFPIKRILFDNLSQNSAEYTGQNFNDRWLCCLL